MLVRATQPSLLHTWGLRESEDKAGPFFPNPGKNYIRILAQEQKSINHPKNFASVGIFKSAPIATTQIQVSELLKL